MKQTSGERGPLDRTSSLATVETINDPNNVNTTDSTHHEVPVRPREEVLLQVVVSGSRDGLVAEEARERLLGLQTVLELRQHELPITSQELVAQEL